MASKQNMHKDVFIDGVPTTATMNRIYHRYVNRYAAIEEKLARKGQKMYLRRKNREEFEAYYMAVYNESGVKGSSGFADKLITDLAEDSAYKYSKKQAAALTKGLNTMGIGAQKESVLAGNYDDKLDELYETIERRRADLFGLGYTDEMVRKAIGVEFFGSPE